MSEVKIPLGGAMAEAKDRELSKLVKEGKIKVVTYTQEDIQLCINCLNDMTTKGIENARIIAIIADKLLNPLPEAEEKGKEEPDASHKEE